MNKKRIREFNFFMKTALLASKNSFAIRNKVGAVFVKDGRIISTGWNGQPTGFDNCCEEKLSDGILKTLPTVIHAEANAICFCAKNGIDLKNSDLYVTLSPCINCALLLIQTNIKNVFYYDEYRDKSGIILLNKAKIKTMHIKKYIDFDNIVENK